MPRDVAVWPRDVLFGLVVPAVVDPAVVRAPVVGGAPEMVGVEGLALE